jgi:hypothetical protein
MLLIELRQFSLILSFLKAFVTCWIWSNSIILLSMMLCTYNPRSQEAEAGGLWVSGQTQLHSETLSLKKIYFFIWSADILNYINRFSNIEPALNTTINHTSCSIWIFSLPVGFDSIFSWGYLHPWSWEIVDFNFPSW